MDNEVIIITLPMAGDAAIQALFAVFVSALGLALTSKIITPTTVISFLLGKLGIN